MKYVCIILALGITFLSCSKDDIDKGIILASGTWKLTRHMTDYDKDGIYEEDTYAFIHSCIKDNIYTFQADGIAITDEGPIKCDSINPQATISSWSFSDHQRRFHFEGINYEIEELNETTFRLITRISYGIIFKKDVKSIYTKQ